jgi:hypothetical protein
MMYKWQNESGLGLPETSIDGWELIKHERGPTIENYKTGEW